jgi:uncharacterized protein DUF955
MPSVSELQVFICYSHADMKGIASSAKHLRETLNISLKEALPIFDVLEFRIADFFKEFRFVVDLDHNFDPSVLAMTRQDPPEIIVRESVYQHAAVGSEPARVVLAHELGHFWLGHGGNVARGVAPSLEHSQLEWQADEFAAELLMPGNIAKQMTADHIAKQFAVPLKTAKIRRQALEARQKSLSATNNFGFEAYTGLLSRFEKEVLNWVPTNCPTVDSFNTRSG